MLNVVVFPAPFGPNKAKMVFWETPKVTSSTTLFSDDPNVFAIFKTRSESEESEEAATFDASASTSSCTSLRTGSVCGFLSPWIWAESLWVTSEDPVSTHTRMTKSVSAYRIRYTIGPPYLVIVAIDDVDTGLVPLHNRENKFTDTKDARSCRRILKNAIHLGETDNIPHLQRGWEVTSCNLWRILNRHVKPGSRYVYSRMIVKSSAALDVFAYVSVRRYPAR